MFGEKPLPTDVDPVVRLLLDVERSATALAGAVNAARLGVRGVSYEDWFLLKKINEELSKAGMQAIPLEP
jgi:hypothetical protein